MIYCLDSWFVVLMLNDSWNKEGLLKQQTKQPDKVGGHLKSLSMNVQTSKVGSLKVGGQGLEAVTNHLLLKIRVYMYICIHI